MEPKTTYVEQGFDHTDEDDGTMPESVEALAKTVIGHRVIDVRNVEITDRHSDTISRTELTLDDGRTVVMDGVGDCCAHTEVTNIAAQLPSVDHIITNVRTQDGYERWFIYADAGDVWALSVEWSAGNPFYYSYGFEITVRDTDVATEEAPDA